MKNIRITEKTLFLRQMSFSWRSIILEKIQYLNSFMIDHSEKNAQGMKKNFKSKPMVQLILRPFLTFLLFPILYILGGILLQLTIIKEAYAQNTITVKVVNQNNINCVGANTGKFTIDATGGTPPYKYSIDGGFRYGDNPTFQQLYSGSYTVLVRDQSNGFGFTNIKLDEPASLPTIKYDVINPSGCMNSNGKIIMNVTGGTPPFEYSLGQGVFQTNNEFINLLPGGYIVAIRDASNCIYYQYVFLYDLLPFNVKLESKIDPSSCIASDGSIKLTTPENGTPPYYYTIRRGTAMPQSSNDGTFSNLNAGRYLIEVFESKGCATSMYIELNYQTDLDFTYEIVKSPICQSGTGDVRIIPSGGSPPYIYKVDGVLSVNSLLTNLSASSHLVSVTDSKGCEKYIIIYVRVSGNGLKMNAEIVKEPGCFGKEDGEIKVQGIDGAGGYLYSIDNINYAINNVFSNLKRNSYTVYVKDQDGCITSKFLRLTNPIKISVDTLKYPTCLGKSKSGNGEIRINASGTEGPFEYSSDNGVTWSNDPVIKNLSEYGNSIWVRDRSGTANDKCQNEINFSFIMENEYEFLLNNCTVEVVQPNCDGTPGRMVIHTNDKSKRFTPEYSIDNINWRRDSVFDYVKPGKYQPMVRIKYCNLDTALTREIGEAVIIKSDVDFLAKMTSPSNCRDSNATIRIYAFGKKPLEYSIDNGTNFSPDSVFTGLPAGLYTLMVKDADGCKQRSSLEVKKPETFRLTTAVAGVTRSGGNDGILMLDIAGSYVAPITLKINDWVTTEQNFPYQKNGLLEGVYEIEATDASGCVSTATVYLGIDDGAFTSEVSGIVYKDLNGNGAKDSDEPVVPNWMVFVLKNGQIAYEYTSTDENGVYSLSLPRGDYALYARKLDYSERTQPKNEDLYPLNIVSIDSSIVAKDFGFKPNMDKKDVSVSITRLGSPTPGSNVRFFITRHNRAHGIMDGELSFKNDPQIEPKLFAPDPANILPGEAKWNYSNFQSGEFINYTVSSTIKTDAKLNSECRDSANISPKTDDYPENNGDFDLTVISRPYDPNTKVAQLEDRSPADTCLDKTWIYYTIYFQNVGTAPAVNVRIWDEFDINHDFLALEMLGSSSPITEMKFRGGSRYSAVATESRGIAQWTLGDINLPAKSQDELGSQGFIRFRVPIKDLKTCDVPVVNAAKIYFDYEDPIETPIASTFVNPTSEGVIAAPETLYTTQTGTFKVKDPRWANESIWTFPGGDIPGAKGLGPEKVKFPVAGNYEISLELDNGSGDCIQKRTANLTVLDCPVILDQNIKKTICQGDTTMLRSPILNMKYSWNNSTTDTMPNFIANREGQYILTIMDPITLCPQKVIFDVEAGNCNIVPPNVFSPNGDGINDYFELQSDNIVSLKAYIFDRWGVEIYKSDGTSLKWDGTKGGTPKSEGVYFYHLEILTGQNKEIKRSGTVTLLR